MHEWKSNNADLLEAINDKTKNGIKGDMQKELTYAKE